jgi:hypothetical protein
MSDVSELSPESSGAGVESGGESDPAGAARNGAVRRDSYLADHFTPRDTWGSNLPALRVTQVQQPSQSTRAKDASKPAREETRYVWTSPSPSTLRLIRALVGIVLLLVAWAATVGIFLLAQMLLDGPPRDGDQLALGLILYGLGVLATLWLAVTALASMVTGAFALSLAVRVRGW